MSCLHLSIHAKFSFANAHTQHEGVSVCCLESVGGGGRKDDDDEDVDVDANEHEEGRMRRKVEGG